MSEQITVVEKGLQEGQRPDGSTWSRWTIKDGAGRTFSTFNKDFADRLVQGSSATIEFVEKDLKPGADGTPRKVKNITFVDPPVEDFANGAEPKATQPVTVDTSGYVSEDMRICRMAIWKSFLEGQLAASLYAKAVSANKEDMGIDPMDYVIITGTRIVVHAEKDVFERAPGDDGIPFKTAGDE